MRAVAAAGLPSTRHQLPRLPLEDTTWWYLLQRADYERLAGIVGHAIDTGALPATDEQRQHAAQLRRKVLETCLLLESELIATTEVLRESRVEHRVLKGPATAHLDYPDPAMRAFGDIDLLVRSEQFDAAVAALRRAGYVRRYRELRPGFDRRFGKGAAFTAPSELETDLHRTWAMGPFGLRIDLGTVWERSSTFVLAGRPFAALDPDTRFLHACYHAALGNAVPRLVPQRDVAQIATRTVDPIDPARVRRLAAAWKGEPVVARAITLAWDAFDLAPTELSRWAAAYDPTPRETRDLRTYLDPQMGFAARSIAALCAVPSWRDKAAFAWALAVPSRDYASGRHRSRWERFRAATREARSLYRRP